MERSVSSQVIPPTSQPPLALPRYVWVDLRLTPATGQRPLILLKFGLVQCVASPAGIAPFLRVAWSYGPRRTAASQTESPTIGPRRSLVVGVRVAAFSRRNLRL